MSITHNKTKPVTDAGSATSGVPFLPAPAYSMPIDQFLSAAGGVEALALHLRQVLDRLLQVETKTIGDTP